MQTWVECLLLIVLLYGSAVSAVSPFDNSIAQCTCQHQYGELDFSIGKYKLLKLLENAKQPLQYKNAFNLRNDFRKEPMGNVEIRKEELYDTSVMPDATGNSLNFDQLKSGTQSQENPNRQFDATETITTSERATSNINTVQTLNAKQLSLRNLFSPYQRQLKKRKHFVDSLFYSYFRFNSTTSTPSKNEKPTSTTQPIHYTYAYNFDTTTQKNQLNTEKVNDINDHAKSPESKEDFVDTTISNKNSRNTKGKKISATNPPAQPEMSNHLTKTCNQKNDTNTTTEKIASTNSKEINPSHFQQKMDVRLNPHEVNLPIQNRSIKLFQQPRQKTIATQHLPLKTTFQPGREDAPFSKSGNIKNYQYPRSQEKPCEVSKNLCNILKMLMKPCSNTELPLQLNRYRNNSVSNFPSQTTRYVPVGHTTDKYLPITYKREDIVPIKPRSVFFV